MDYALYLHIPFCRHRCAYCDFNTYAGLESWMGPYMDALGREVGSLSGKVPGEISTVYFGGGTPSLVPGELLRRLFDTLAHSLSVRPDAEITLEANPGTLTKPYLENLRSLGVNRLSMGMQSASPEDLRVLEREHSYFDVLAAVLGARQAGFENINLDLIFGLPSQTMKSWQDTLERAIELQPDHFSVYQLILEHGTPMNAWVQRGLVPAPDEDLAADMYEYTKERLANAGYEAYEISNWARSKTNGELMACRHNLQYWRSLPYLGLGAGAHGFAAGVRTVNVRAPQAYVERMSGGGHGAFPRTPATVNASKLTPEEEMGEVMMMGLRLVREGVSDRHFTHRFGISLQEAFNQEINQLVEQGLLEWIDDLLVLTDRGVMLGNRVFMAFLPG